MAVDCSTEAGRESIGIYKNIIAEKIEESELTDDIMKQICCHRTRYLEKKSIGCVKPDINPFDDEIVVNYSNSIIETLVNQNMFVPFKTKNRDEYFCFHKGWEQGSGGTDCYLDSCLFVLFGNDTLSVLFGRKLDELYESSSNTNLKNVIYCISLYVDLLTASRPETISRLNSKDITVSVDTDLNFPETILEFKQSIKWCLLWYTGKYIIEEHGTDSIEYQTIVERGLLPFIRPDKFDFSGGETSFVLAAFQIMFNIYIKWNQDIFGQSFDYSQETPDKLYELINNTISQTENDIIVIPFQYRIQVDTLASVLFPTNGKLEGIIHGSIYHEQSFVRCSNKWLEYDNQAKNTAIVNNDTDEETNMKIIHILTNKQSTM